MREGSNGQHISLLNVTNVSCYLPSRRVFAFLKKIYSPLHPFSLFLCILLACLILPISSCILLLGGCIFIVLLIDSACHKGWLSDDPRNFVKNKTKEILVHKRLIFSNKFFSCNFSLGCIGLGTEIFELCL